MESKFTAEIITFREVYDRTYQLARTLMEASESFDIVLAIARGGMLPGRLICDFLNIGHLSSLQIRHYEAGASQREKAVILDPVRIDIKGRNVLLIDDVNDTGNTLQAAVSHVQELHPARLKTAVIHEKSTTGFKADYAVEYLEEWRWLIYEWAATEDILEFLKNGDQLSENEETAYRFLAEQYDLTVDKRLFQNVMEMKRNYFPEVKK